MEVSKDFVIKVHLDLFSELEFKRLIEKDFNAYFPYDDIGIDIVAFPKNDPSKPEFYQLKAANTYKRNPKQYWFNVLKNVKKYRTAKEKPIFFIFCAFDMDTKQFDFFKIPFETVDKYIKQKVDKKKFFQIKKNHKKKYEIVPRDRQLYPRNKDINDYLINR